jgi:hypothetical protein
MKPKSLLFPLILLCTAATLSRAAEPYVVVKEMKGTVEARRAGLGDWVPIEENEKLYNNDMVRSQEKSRARLAWSTGSEMFLHEQSQVLINLAQSTKTNFVSKHATVFFGAVFYVVKKSLPRLVSSRFDTKVYTPTAVVAIRGTSFRVDVDPKNGGTDVDVLSGTVLVRNILKKESIFLSAGYRTHVALNSDPVRPKALFEERIEQLKTWVPEKVIEEEMDGQIKLAKRDHYVVTGKLEKKLLVTTLTNVSEYGGPWEVDETLARFLAERVRRNMTSLKVGLVEDTVADPIALGEKGKAKFVITGEIREFDIVEKAEITVKADKYRELVIARVELLVRVIDVEERKLILERLVGGEVSGEISPANTWKTIGKLSLDLNDKGFEKTILGKAVSQAINQASEHVVRYLK